MACTSAVATVFRTSSKPGSVTTSAVLSTRFGQLVDATFADPSVFDQHRRDVFAEASGEDLVGNSDRLLVVLDRHPAGIRLALVERWLRHRAFTGLELRWTPVAIQLFGRNPGEVDNLWVYPGPAVNGLGRCGDLQAHVLGASEIDRVANTVIKRTEHRDTPRPDPVSHGQKVVECVHVERHVLHRSAGTGGAGATRMRHTNRSVDSGNIWRFHESDVTTVVHLHKPVPCALDTMHPVEGYQLASQYVVEERDLCLDVLGGDRQMMDSVVTRHLKDPSDHQSSEEAGRGTIGCVYARTISDMVITPVSPVFGADVSGIDLDGPLSDSTFAAIHHAFLRYGVLFFRNQQVIPEATQVALARRFGPLHTHPAAPTTDADAAVFVIHTHRDSTVANGNGWHTDVSCDEEPPMATMLHIHTLPEGGGGDTLFASMEAAYQALPGELRERLRGLSALHESEHVYRGRYADRGVDDRETTYPIAEHPVVRTHPETGRLSIYVNRSFTTRIVGMDLTESDELLRWLFRHVERPEFQVRLRWAKNDLALWDNRCVQHFAIWDYWPNERKGNRVTILGDRPFLDPDSVEPPVSNLRLSGGSLAPKARDIDS